MKINIFDIFGYIFKWKYLIVLITALSVLACSSYVNKKQSYTAQIIIRYEDENAKQGLAPTGEPLDVYEILSPSVLSAVISDLGIKVTVEDIRSRCVILPIIPSAEEELKKSKLKAGEEYSFSATDYVVKYTVGSSKNGGYARDVLDAIIKNYNTYYSEKYLTQSVLPQIDFDVTSGVYDYLETAEIMNEKVKTAIEYLEGKAIASPDFRSSLTGYSFGDLNEKYRVIKNFDLPTLFSDIFRGQVSKNEDVLLKKYAYREQQHWLDSKSKNTDASTALGLMKEFVNSNKMVPNSYNTDKKTDFSNQDIYVNKDAVRSKTTYDKLVDDYVTNGVKSGEVRIDAGYCDAIINIFNKPNPPGEMQEQLKKTVEDRSKSIFENIKNLSAITNNTISDFNRYNASQDVVMLSGVAIGTDLSMGLYMLIGLVIGFLLSIVTAIAIELIKSLKKGKIE